MSGMHSALVIRPVEDAIALPSVRLVMTLQRKSVPPEPIILTAMPTMVMFVRSLKAKKPIISASPVPTTSAASRPQSQLLA